MREENGDRQEKSLLSLLQFPQYIARLFSFSFSISFPHSFSKEQEEERGGGGGGGLLHQAAKCFCYVTGFNR